MGSPFNANSPTATPNFDNLLIQSLMSRLQLRHPPPPQHPLLSPSLEELLLDAAANASFSFSDDEEEEGDFSDGGDHRSQLSKEESKLEKELVKIILSGNTEALKPNTGQAVTVGEHHVCVGYHDEKGSEYRVWEWHGHIMLFDDDNGYTPEYIYGNYFERRFNLFHSGSHNHQNNKVVVHDDDDEDEDEDGHDELVSENVGGLKDLIQGGDSTATRILHQSRNARSPGVLKGTSGN